MARIVNPKDDIGKPTRQDSSIQATPLDRNDASDTLETGPSSPTQAVPFLWAVLASLAALIVGIICVSVWGSGMGFPADVGRDTGKGIDVVVKWLTREGAGVFDIIRSVIIFVLINLRDALLWIPWPALTIAVGLLAWRVAGVRVALFGVVSILGIGFMGLWESAMETLALVVTAVVLSITIGVPLGILGARNSLADSVMRPILDGMQTMPSFVYLVPAILFFSLGNVPAVMATIVYAVPPAIRFTNLGIRQVAPEVTEAARAFGTTPTQLLLKVQIPMALPTIMAGINQTTMMALAMVVVASLVGAGGLGEDVLRALGRQQPGASAIAGLSIVLMAITIDRITQGFALKQQQSIEGSRR